MILRRDSCPFEENAQLFCICMSTEQGSWKPHGSLLLAHMTLKARSSNTFFMNYLQFLIFVPTILIVQKSST